MKWEYKISEVKREGLNKGWTREPEKVEQFLNELGKDGWEIVTFDRNYASTFEVGTSYALAKRQLSK